MPAYREVRVLSVAEAAYLAGLIDGEGTVTLSRKHADEMRQLPSVLAIRVAHSGVRARQRWRGQADSQKDKQGSSRKYTETMRAARYVFENALLSLVSGDRKKEPLQPRG